MNDDNDSKARFNFRAYELALRFLRLLAPVLTEIARHDPDLARQGRRAGSSIALNLAEGAESPGKLRTVRYRNSLGSTNEVLACLDVAEALGYVRVDEELRDVGQHLRATEINLVRPTR